MTQHHRPSIPVALGLLTLLGCASGSTVEVEAGEIAGRVVARGVVVPRDGVARVRPRHTGAITEIHVAVGDPVERGDLLALVDSEFMVAEEELRAERGGIVIARRTGLGDMVSPADEPVFEIADASRIDLRFEIEEEDASLVRGGQPAEVVPRGGGDALFAAEVARVAPSMTERLIGRGDARARAGGLVRAGWLPLEASADFPLGRELEVVIELEPVEVRARVPLSALQIREGRAVVLRAGSFADEAIEVEVGHVDGTHVEVWGVEPGTVVRVAR